MVLLLATIEDFDRNIFTLCKHINAATYELLVLIREFDERAGWLAWRCDRRSGFMPSGCLGREPRSRLTGSTAAGLSSLALPTQASKQADLPFRNAAESRRSRGRLVVECC